LRVASLDHLHDLTELGAHQIPVRGASRLFRGFAAICFEHVTRIDPLARRLIPNDSASCSM
jgi:hypothetical protein